METRNNIKEELRLHFKALQHHPEIADSLNSYIINALETSPYVAKEGTEGKCKPVKLRPMRTNTSLSMTAINTKYPLQYITPIDKVSNQAFTGELNTAEIQKIAMERRGNKKQITTFVRVNFENLNGDIKIQSRKELTAYDREVHDAITTLFVDGGNEYITPQMIYQVMTGDPKARLKEKQTAAISDSITKCMYSRIIINADEDAKAYGFDSFKYDGNLISGERVTAALNGNIVECLHILRTPVLYEYAEKKKQIGRFNIKLLNSPINKTEEIIILQGYLYRRVLSMKSGNLSKTILYDTVYDQLGIVEAASPAALKMKKSKIRKQTKDILEYWKAQKFISGYEENTRKTEIHSVTVQL